MSPPVQEAQQETATPIEVTHGVGSSSAPTAMGRSRGKRAVPGSELVDVVNLQNRVFQLEQESSENDLLIGKLDVRVSELEKDNSAKDAKILEPQTNLGGLTAFCFDLKQRLNQKFGNEFKPLSTEGERATPSGSSQSAHVVR